MYFYKIYYLNSYIKLFIDKFKKKTTLEPNLQRRVTTFLYLINTEPTYYSETFS